MQVSNVDVELHAVATSNKLLRHTFRTKFSHIRDLLLVVWSREESTARVSGQGFRPGFPPFLFWNLQK